MQLRRSGAAEGTADSTASGAASARRRWQSSFQLAFGAVQELLWSSALADRDRVFNSVRAVSWRARDVRPTAPSVPSADMRCSFVFLQNGMVVSATTSEDEKGKQIPYYCNRRKERNDRNPARSRTLEATT